MKDNLAENISKFTKNNLKLFDSGFMDTSELNEEDKPHLQRHFLDAKLSCKL